MFDCVVPPGRLAPRRASVPPGPDALPVLKQAGFLIPGLLRRLCPLPLALPVADSFSSLSSQVQCHLPGASSA